MTESPSLSTGPPLAPILISLTHALGPSPPPAPACTRAAGHAKKSPASPAQLTHACLGHTSGRAAARTPLPLPPSQGHCTLLALHHLSPSPLHRSQYQSFSSISQLKTKTPIPPPSSCCLISMLVLRQSPHHRVCIHCFLHSPLNSTQ